MIKEKKEKEKMVASPKRDVLQFLFFVYKSLLGISIEKQYTVIYRGCHKIVANKGLPKGQ